MTLNQFGKLNTLQSIRAIAVLLVLFFHMSRLFQGYYQYDFLFGAFRFGFMGVDIFFVLSGFIIYYIHHKDIGRSNRTKPFLIKRFNRIFPVYWIAFIPLIPMYFLIPSLGKGDEQNLAVILKSLFLIPQERFPILEVAWSLQYEIMFYLIFGLIIFSKSKIVKIIVGVWLLASLICPFFFGESTHYLLTFTISPLNLEFFFGCVVAYLVLQRKIAYPKFFVLAGVVITLITWMYESLPVSGTHRMLTYGIASALIVYGIASLDLSEKVGNSRILGYLGDASYSIYLTHYTLISFLNKAFSAVHAYKYIGYGVSSVVIVLIAIVAGCLFHSLIEKPILNLTKSFFDKKQIRTAEHAA